MAALTVELSGFDVAATREFLDGVGGSITGGVARPNWLADDRFWYVRNDEQQTVAAWLVDPAARSRVELVNLEKVASALGENLGVAEAPEFRITAYLEAAEEVGVTAAGRSWLFNRRTGEIRVDDGAPQHVPGIARDMFPINFKIREELSPGGRYILSLSDNDVILREVDSGLERKLTSDGTDDVPWFFAGDIMEPNTSEWSPDGRVVALRRHDMRDVSAWPIVDWLKINPEVTPFRYWAKAGQALPVTSFHLLDIESGEMIDVEIGGDPNHYAAFYGWSPDGSSIWFYRAFRDMSRIELIEANAQTGACRVVLREEREDGYVEFPWNGIRNLYLLDDGEHLLWYSDRSGWAHWYRYHRDGTLVNAVTSGEWETHGIVRVDEDANRVWLMGSPDSDHPYDGHLLRASLDGSSEVEQITSVPGTRSVSLSPSGKHFVEFHHNLARPPRSDLRTSDGRLLMTLEEASVDTDFRGSWSVPESFVVNAADGKTAMHGIILKPQNFDPGQSYPVVLRVYGGMQSRVVPRGFFGYGTGGPGSEYTTMLAYYAERGFAVVMMDAPGTPGRGRAFNMVASGTWPQGVMKDQVAGLMSLKAKYPWLDLDRVGVDGNSWGGYMALRAMIEYPELFRGAVAAVPESTFLDHAAWIEMKLGPPAANPGAYDEGNLHDKLDRLAGPVLIVVGSSDGNVGYSSEAKLLDALAEAGKPYDLVFFPGTNHAHQGRGDRYAYAVTASAAFLLRHLEAKSTVCR